MSMIGLAGLRSMKRAMDSTRNIVKHNLLRTISRSNSIEKKKNTLTFHVSINDRKKAYILSEKIKKNSSSWKYAWIITLLTLVIGILFFRFYIWFFLGIICLTIPYLLFQSFMLAKKEKPYIGKNMRKSHLKKERTGMIPDYVI